MTSLARAGYVIRVLVLGVMLVVLAYALFRVLTSGALVHQPCDNGALPLGIPTSGYFVFATLGAFVAGHVVSAWRHFDSEGTEESDAEHRRISVVIHVLLVALLVLVVAALAYETWALFDGTRRWPITSFVRCADRTKTVTTLITASTVSYLLGHWLWHPVDEETRNAV